MVAAALISLLAGMVLAQRFKVLILLPVMLLTLVIALSTAIAGTDGAWTAGLTAALIILGLQVGYLLGLGLRQVMVLTRATRRQPASLRSPLPPQRPAH